MKTLKTLIIVSVVFGIAASAHAIKVHQRLFMMTNQIEAAHSVGMVEMDEADGMTNGVDLADGTVAVYTNGMLYVYHGGVWQEVAGQGGAITDVVGDDGINAVKTGDSVELDVVVGNGAIIDGSDQVAVGDGAGIVVNANDVAVGDGAGLVVNADDVAVGDGAGIVVNADDVAVGDGDGLVVNANDVAVGDGAGLVVNADDVAVGAGDGITVNADDVAVDATVVRTFGDQNITGNKLFSDIFVTNLFAINETIVNTIVSNVAIVATNLSVEGIIDMNNNQITNLAAATRGDMAVNYTQLTNVTQNVQGDLIAATNQVYIDATSYTDGALNTANNYTDSATNALMQTAEDTFVNEAGDNMTGILGMGANRIENVANAVNAQGAVTHSQLEAATNGITVDVSLQDAYEEGNTISTSFGNGDVIIGGTEGVEISTADGLGITGGDLYVANDAIINGGASVDGNTLQVRNGNNIQMSGSGGDIQVNGAGGGQVNMDGATGNESVRLEGGKLVIYSGGSLALEFE